MSDEVEGALFVVVIVLSLFLLCSCWCCCATPADKRRGRERATGDDRRRTMNTAEAKKVARRAHAPTAALSKDVQHRAYFRHNSRGMAMFVQEVFPNEAPMDGAPDTTGDGAKIKGIVLNCHGYLDNPSLHCVNNLRRLASNGYAVFCMDYAGHGKSDGLQGYIEDFNTMVSDVETYHLEVMERFPRHKFFLAGDSMGGAVALQLHFRAPARYHGAVLTAPMVKIADEMKPAPLVVKILLKIAEYFPTAKAVPSGKDLLDRAFQDETSRQIAKDNPIGYEEWPRLATARELLRLSTDCEDRLGDVELPFLVMHGVDDTVTSPLLSQELVDRAKSTDKTFKKYPGMWHALLVGEPAENTKIVWNDVITWLDAHTAPSKDDGAVEESKAGEEPGAGATVSPAGVAVAAESGV